MRQPGVRSPAEVAQDQRIRGATNGHDGPLAMDGITPKKGDGALEQQHKERSEIARGQGGAGGGAPDVPNLKPTQETLERIAGGGSVDHLDDINEGDETSLNAKGWVHATFFNRLKRTVAQNWDPSSVMRRRDPNGSRFGSKPRITEVRVALTKTGALAKIVVVSSSGLPELDDEAVRAFHAAAPFVNPPGQLVNSDGLIVFAFGFYLEAGQQERTSWSYRRM
jgi:TonB family protein